MMGLYSAVLLMHGLMSLENTIWQMQDMVSQHGCLLPTEGYDTIYVNGVKVTYGIFIAALMFHTNFSQESQRVVQPATFFFTECCRAYIWSVEKEY